MHLQLSFVIVAGISAGIYFLFLSYIIYRVFRNISAKRQALPAMASSRRQFYEGVIYRFKFLMLATLLCAAMTVIGFILGQVQCRLSFCVCDLFNNVICRRRCRRGSGSGMRTLSWNILPLSSLECMECGMCTSWLFSASTRHHTSAGLPSRVRISCFVPFLTRD